jgi:hypothetical protein
MLYDVDLKRPKQKELDAIRHNGLGVHVWTFKDDDLPFGAPNALRAYEIGQNQLNLDGVIT